MTAENLPPGWQIVRLNDLGVISGGGTPSTKVPGYWGGDIPWLVPSEVTKWNGMFITQTERMVTAEGLANCVAKLLPTGTVMMTSRATIGEVVINAIPMATNQGFINVICDGRIVCSEFLAYWIKQNTAVFEDRANGVTFKEISKSNFKTIPITLPPLPEQRAIARALRAVQEAKEARRREIARERERKVALMQHLFTHGTRNEPRKQTAIGEIPESWQVCEVREVAQVAYGLTVNEMRRKSDQTAPYLTVANVTRGALRLDDVKQIGISGDDSERYRVKRGDVLLVEGNGNPRLLGSAVVWNNEMPFVLHQNHLIRARPAQNKILPHWLMAYLNSDSGRSQLLGKAKTSSGLHSINSRLIGSLNVPVPPLEDQEAIVEAMQCCDAQIAALEREVGLLDELFRSMLEGLMGGRLLAAGSGSTHPPTPPDTGGEPEGDRGNGQIRMLGGV